MDLAGRRRRRSTGGARRAALLDRSRRSEPSCSASGPAWSSTSPEASLAAVQERCSARSWPEVRVLGTGRNLRVLKDTGRPTDTCARYGIAAWQGYLAVAHTRMATESAVTVLHSHPFVPGPRPVRRAQRFVLQLRHRAPPPAGRGRQLRLGQRLRGGGPVPGQPAGSSATTSTRPPAG